MSDKSTDCCITTSTIAQTDCQAQTEPTACIFIFIFYNSSENWQKKHSKI